MSRFVTLEQKVVWKFSAISDGSVDGLFDLHEQIGVGKHYYCIASDSESLWCPIDPMEGMFDGEVLVVSQSDTVKLAQYLSDNCPKPSFLSRLIGRQCKKSDLLQLIEAILEHSSNRERSEFLSWL
ncbi:hypothetical protein J7384_16625 [Endozoicomonas sp. G2_1]|uniref:hypothetical protein n=1 Tax=Endozoicomonas sp. G2_1 TaxID=2821091 RepID=UPI001ADCBD83|nr:hypothetical protein [Endozoicomonas sp. G2_1]MBO9491987.1 hypothetical protein [Endozoicomonas sp. G2_1]